MPKKSAKPFDSVGAASTIIGGVIGLIASFVLSLETLLLASNSSATLSCDLNSVFSCSTVAQDATATILGFPNSFIGLMAFPTVIMIGVLFLSRTKLPSWMMKTITVGVLGGLVFAGWMFYQSFFNISVLCPWCLTTDLGMLAVLYGVLRYQSRVGGSFAWVNKLKLWSEKNYDLAAAIGIIVLVVAGIIAKFGDSLL